MVSKKLPASLFIGAAESGKRSLVSQLIGKQLTSQDSCGRWVIDNSYYTAETKVVIRRPDGSKFGDLHGYEAIVLVFNAVDEASWDSVRVWAEAHSDAMEAAEITMVVASQYDRVHAGQTPAWHADVQAWGMQHRFELVRAAPLHTNTDATLASCDEDYQGVKRVLSALQAHMWPGLVLKQRPAANQQKEGSTAVEQDAGQQPTPTADAAQASNAPQPAGLLVTHQPSSPVTQATQLDDHKGKVEMLTGTESTSKGSDRSKTVNDQAFEDLDAVEDRDMDEFERLFAEMAGARERLSILSDEARREEAANLALRLASAMGLDDEEGDAAGGQDGR